MGSLLSLVPQNIIFLKSHPSRSSGIMYGSFLLFLGMQCAINQSIGDLLPFTRGHSNCSKNLIFDILLKNQELETKECDKAPRTRNSQHRKFLNKSTLENRQHFQHSYQQRSTLSSQWQWMSSVSCLAKQNYCESSNPSLVCKNEIISKAKRTEEFFVKQLALTPLSCTTRN